MSNSSSPDEASLGTQHSVLGTELVLGTEYLISVQVEPRFEEGIDVEAMHRLAVAVLRAEGAESPLELGIVITTDDEVHALNLEYLGHDYKTDVISFGMQGEGAEEFITPAERPAYLGDVVISYDRACEQALEYRHTSQLEVATLLVHGLLHLLGYNDLEDADRAHMHARQDELVEASGFGSQVLD